MALSNCKNNEKKEYKLDITPIRVRAKEQRRFAQAVVSEITGPGVRIAWNMHFCGNNKR